MHPEPQLLIHGRERSTASHSERHSDLCAESSTRHATQLQSRGHYTTTAGRETRLASPRLVSPANATAVEGSRVSSCRPVPVRNSRIPRQISHSHSHNIPAPGPPTTVNPIPDGKIDRRTFVLIGPTGWPQCDPGQDNRAPFMNGRTDQRRRTRGRSKDVQTGLALARSSIYSRPAGMNGLYFDWWFIRRTGPAEISRRAER